MPQSLSHLLVHLVFSTKDRSPFIGESVRKELHAFLAGTVRTAGCECLCIGGTADHVHCAVDLARTISVAQLIEDIKTSSSAWVKRQSAPLAKFAWQRGYGAFSVGASGYGKLARYIAMQEEHHKTVSFQDELRAVLKKYNKKYDERYVWD